MKKIIYILALLIFYTGAVLAEPDLKAATNDICNCLDKPYKVAQDTMKKIEQAQRLGDVSKLTESQAELMNIINAASKCFEALPKKYPEIDKNVELQNRVMSMAEKKCPHPVSSMTK